MSENVQNPAAVAAARDDSLDRLAWLLDASIRLPGGFRIGLDSVMGLIPGLGDGAGMATSGYILLQGYRAGVGKSVLARMFGNVLIESLIGVIPILGDIFDMYWKSNLRNVALIRAHQSSPDRVRGWSRAWLAALALGTIVVLLGALYLGYLILHWLLSAWLG